MFRHLLIVSGCVSLYCFWRLSGIVERIEGLGGTWTMPRPLISPQFRADCDAAAYLLQGDEFRHDSIRDTLSHRKRSSRRVGRYEEGI
ncbi:hypothetical protein BKA70DRAFT_715466 [Coprinopsis sp. MPI-PUGE-AT-0042]|nr:hypothetical protein BKA70DRAFT_715466 [Coprinopsis sp. MPI-PUGE-AT-0042]